MPHKPFSELVAKMSPAAQKRSRKKTSKILAEMELRELREALEITQVELAKKLKTTQAAVSRLEKRRHMLIDTLGGYVEGLGGRIEVHAVLPGRTVSLTHFLREKKAAPRSTPNLAARRPVRLRTTAKS
jgi:transcriptional regulator with XRE-family HTH domain